MGLALWLAFVGGGIGMVLGFTFGEETLFGCASILFVVGFFALIAVELAASL